MFQHGLPFLVLLFSFHAGFAQNDLLPDAKPTSASTDSTTEPAPHRTEPNPDPGKRTTIYTLKPSVDIPVITVATAFSLYAMTQIYDKPVSTEAEVTQLNTEDINAFDRWSIHPYNSDLHDVSDVLFYSSIPLPLILFLTRHDTRSDFWKLSCLYWEALSITGLFGSGAPYFIDRYRPYVYTSETPMDKRTSSNAKNSAFSGHVEVVATSTFFAAKVYSDYFPESKWMAFGLATVATGGMAYLRMAQGMHFPSDVLIGAAIGTLSGILVPHFHKHRLIKNAAVSLLPVIHGQFKGFTCAYKFK